MPISLTDETVRNFPCGDITGDITSLGDITRDITLRGERVPCGRAGALGERVQAKGSRSHRNRGPHTQCGETHERAYTPNNASMAREQPKQEYSQAMQGILAALHKELHGDKDALRAWR